MKVRKVGKARMGHNTTRATEIRSLLRVVDNWHRQMSRPRKQPITRLGSPSWWTQAIKDSIDDDLSILADREAKQIICTFTRAELIEQLDRAAELLNSWLDQIEEQDGPKAAFQCFSDLLE